MRWVARVLLGGLVVLGGWAAPALPQEAPEVDPQAPVGAGPAEPQETTLRVRRGDETAVFQDIHIRSDEVVRGQVTCVGGDAVIEGRVTRGVVVIGGTLDLSGVVEREVVGVLSDIRLREGSRVGREMITVLGELEDEGADLYGGNVNIPWPLGFIPSLRAPFGVVGSMVATFKLIGLMLTLIVVLLLVVFVPERVQTISDAVPVNLGMAYVYGLLGYLFLWIVMPVVYLFLTVIVVGIPLVPALSVAIGVLKILGMTGILHYVGLRLGQSIGREMSLLGAILLGFLPFAVLLVVPALFGLIGVVLSITVSVLFWILIKVPALGLVLMTRAGRRPPGEALPQAAPSPPAPSPLPSVPQP